MSIKLSIIVPVYNSEKGIKDTLNSIINQCLIKELFLSIEVVVVDNNSTDNTYNISKSYSLDYEFIKIYQQNTIQGSYASRNFGKNISNGEFLLFVDADIVLDKYVLKFIFKEIEKQKLEYVAFNVKMKLSSNSLSSKMNFLRGFDIENSIKTHNYTPTCALLVSRLLFDSVNGFNSNLESGGDFVFGVKVFENNFNQKYFDHIRLYHPTRTTYKSLISKSNRVARGNVQLALENPSKYEYLYKRHFKLSNLKPRNPFSYQKEFKKNKLNFSFVNFLISPFFHIPISIIRMIHAKKFYNLKLKK
jgi:glycosyltransferase involved in cell wall biosynthesis